MKEFIIEMVKALHKTLQDASYYENDRGELVVLGELVVPMTDVDFEFNALIERLEKEKPNEKN